MHNLNILCSYLQHHQVPALGAVTTCNLVSGYLTLKIMSFITKYIKKYVGIPFKKNEKGIKKLAKALILPLPPLTIYTALNAVAIKILRLNLPLGLILVPSCALPLFWICKKAVNFRLKSSA